MTGISGYINNSDNSLYLVRKYARIFVRGDYLFGEANCELRGTDDIVSKKKYPRIFSPQMKATVLKIYFTTRVLKTGEDSRIFLSFSWGIFGQVTYLGQSRASENI